MFFTESEVKAELSSKTPANTSMCNNHVTLCLYYSGEYYSRGGLRMIIPGGEAPALGCDPSLQTEASIPIIKSDLPGRHVEWISLCTAEPSVTVIRLQSASTLRGRWKGEKKRAVFTSCVTAEGTEEGSRRNQWPEPTTYTPAKEKNKRLSPPSIQSDNKPSTSKM